MEPTPNQQTGTQGDQGTGGGANTPPAATPTPTTPATGDDELVSIKKSDLAALQAQRDKNHNNAQDANKRMSQLEYVVEPMLVDRELTSFLETNQKDFPDVTKEDLSHAVSLDPEYLKAEATRLQARFQQVRQKAVIDIENPPKKLLSEEEKNAEIEKLRTSKEPGRFQRMMALRKR